MKRIISLFLSLLMVVSLAPTALADGFNDTTISFTITSDGKDIIYVPTGTEITVDFSLVNKTNEGASFTVESIWAEILLGTDFFEIDDSKIESDITNYAYFDTSRNGTRKAVFNGEHTNYPNWLRPYTSGETVGTFKLTVKATSGQITLTTQSLSLYDDGYVSYNIVTNPLTVIVGDEPSTLYTVKYMSENNEISSSQNAAGTITIGAAPSNGPANHIFKGWEYGGNIYQPGDSFELSGDTTFNAVWERQTSSYTLTFDTKGGSAIESVTAPENTVINLADYDAPTKDGYTFEGWYLDEAYTNKVTTVRLTGNKTVYAKWKEIPKTTYTLTFNTNGGSAVASITEVENTVIDLSAHSSQKSGYIFDGWYSDAELTNKVVSITLDSNKTIYAKWVAATKPTYTLTFNTNGGSTIADVIKEEGTSVSLSAYKPTKSGYTFDGWYLDSALTKNVTIVTLNANTTIYAKWKVKSTDGGGGGGGGGGGAPAEKHTITFKNSDGTEIDSAKYESGTMVDLVKHIPEKDGYKFEGWYTDAELTNKVTSIKLTDDTTLYAKWVVSDGETVIAKPDYKPGILTDEHYAYIVGRDGGMIAPESDITRAEVATIIYRLLNEDERNNAKTNENVFTDVNDGDWFNTAVSTLAGLKLVNGRTADTFAPNAYITRAELATIFARMVEVKYDGKIMFSDVSGHWAESYINEAATAKWIVGYDGLFRPDDNITRAEVMTLVNRVLNREPENKNDLLDGMTTWKDNADETAWYYLAVQEATNSHSYEMKADGKYEKWTELQDAPNWAEIEN